MSKAKKAVKVSLRKKPISKGRLSLYLDFYPSIINPTTGKKTRREFLNMYVWENPASVSKKRENREKLKEAEAIRIEREYELLSGDYYKEDNVNIDFVQYFLEHVKGYENGKHKTYLNMMTAFARFNHFCNGQMSSDQLTPQMVKKYRSYLDTALSFTTGKPISQNTKQLNFAKFRSVVRKAYGEGIFEKNPAAFVKNFKVESSKREFLTMEEVRQLFDTPVTDNIIAKVSKFAILTGLRYSDIEKLKWSEVHYSDALGYHLKYKQKKTSSYEVLPISKEAFDLLGERKEGNQLVFDNLFNKTTMQRKLKQWVTDSGIDKHITYHCFRHTYATLQLHFGTELFTIMKTLGHKSIKTTQIYAKIMDTAKVQAANAIPSF